MAGSSETKADGYVSRGFIGNKLGDGEGRHTTWTPLQQFLQIILDNLKTTDSIAKIDPSGEGIVAPFPVRPKPGLVHRLNGRMQSILGEISHRTDFLTVQQIRRIKIPDLSRHFRRIFGGVEFGERLDAGLPRFDLCPEVLYLRRHRIDGSHTGDHNPSSLHVQHISSHHIAIPPSTAKT
jgi:hypothetical protein